MVHLILILILSLIVDGQMLSGQLFVVIWSYTFINELVPVKFEKSVILAELIAGSSEKSIRQLLLELISVSI